MPSAKTITADFEKAESYILDRLQNELAPTLFYHGYHHTLDVIEAAIQIADAENISEEEKTLLRIAAAFHDAGFIYAYNNNEAIACEIVQKELPRFGFNEQQIEMICGMIMATQIPQQPKNKLEEIICDADLDYFGREDVYNIAKTLFIESKIYNDMVDEKEWNKRQINFLKNHHYHTDYSRQTREQKKQEYLNTLLKEM